MHKILHIAPQNYAGVPYDFYRMHLACGDVSRLVTLHKNQLAFPEDICLDFPLPNFDMVKKWRKKKVELVQGQALQEAPVFSPRNLIERVYFPVSDLVRRPRVESIIKRYNFDEYDIIHFDAGLDFYRYPRQALAWKRAGKKIVCCYYGSDLRSRGIIPELDRISDLNLTSEYDHLALKRDLHYIFYPYDPSELPARKERQSDKIVIVHSPTNRIYKGTGLIIEVVRKIQSERRNVEFVLCENMPRQEVLALKAGSDICIDQVVGAMGGTGSGQAGIEPLARWLPENPFVVANNGKELYEALNALIEDEKLRETKGSAGKKWVEKFHGVAQVNAQLYAYYRLKGIV
jgi:glycosyltransferase involved in cell wall biosynthesis